VKGIPEAERGLRTAVIDFIRNRADTGAVDFQGTPLPSQKRMADSLKDIRPTLTKTGIFNPTQLKVMDDIAGDIDRLTAAQGAARPLGSPTAANQEARSRMAQGAARFVLGTIPGVRHVASGVERTYDAIRKTLTEDQINAALVRAARDPKFAADLMKRGDDATIARTRAEIAEELRLRKPSAFDINRAAVSGRAVGEGWNAGNVLAGPGRAAAEDKEDQNHPR
jgi:hypothetical protein